MGTIVDIIFILLCLIMISWTICLRIKDYKKVEPYVEEKCLYKCYINKIVIYLYGVLFILFVISFIIEGEISAYKMVLIVMVITSALSMPHGFRICENGLYFNDLINKPIFFIPYKKIDSWHFNKFDRNLLTIKSEVKSSLFKLPEFKIKKEDVDKVNKILLNYCGEKKDR